MLNIDILGLFFTICLVGARYPHYVFGSALIHDTGRIVMTLLLNGQIDTVVTAGAFSSISVANLDAVKGAVIAFSGPFINYTASAMLGGAELEKTTKILNPFSSLHYPLAVINLRLAFVSFIVTLWQLYCG